MDRPIDSHSCRRFGVEIELNTLDGIIKKANPDTGEIPFGADYIASVVRQASCGKVEIAAWDYIHNNDNWVIKHDMSCGIEINTPVLKGWHGLKKLVSVIDAMSKDGKIKSDKLCSLHVHVGISDMDVRQLASVVAYWIKCEHVFFDSVPAHRKNSRYCHLIGLTDWFDTDFDMDPMEIIARISNSKYGSINTYHFMRGGGFSIPNSDSRQTIEFRIAENAACLDPYFAKNWIRLLLHFVEIVKNTKLPRSYKSGDSSTGLAWLDFPDVYKLLKFDQPLSPGLQQVRQWFMDRIDNNGYNSGLSGIWSNSGRVVSRIQFNDENTKLARINDLEDGLYGAKWIV